MILWSPAYSEAKDMRLSKPAIKKIIGYLSSIIVLVFLGEDFLQGTADVVGIFNAAA